MDKKKTLKKAASKTPIPSKRGRPAPVPGPRKAAAAPARAVPDARAPKSEKDGLAATLTGILQELRALRAAVEPHPAAASGTDAALESSVVSLRRLLSDAIERQAEAVVAKLADLSRDLAARPPAVDRAVQRLDELMSEMGAARFEARALDVVDPLIHTVVAERDDPGATPGTILETVRPGYRSARGLVLAKAGVIVKRRS